MLLITHNHKSDDADPVNRVIGSAGLTGAVDGIFVLEKNKRIGCMARLTIANRDTESHQFNLRFDRQDCRWYFVLETYVDDDCGENNTLYILMECLLDEAPTWRGTATQLCAALTALDREFFISPIGLAKTLKNNQVLLKSKYRIDCNFTRNKTTRLIELSRDTIVADYETVEREPLRLVG